MIGAGQSHLESIAAAALRGSEWSLRSALPPGTASDLCLELAIMPLPISLGLCDVQLFMLSMLVSHITNLRGCCCCVASKFIIVVCCSNNFAKLKSRWFGGI